MTGGKGHGPQARAEIYFRIRHFTMRVFKEVIKWNHFSSTDFQGKTEVCR